VLCETPSHRESVKAFDTAFDTLRLSELRVRTVSSNRNVLSLNRKFGFRQTLVERDYEELFLVYDNLLQLSVRSFDEYLGLFRSDARRLFNREMKQARAAGVRF